MIIIKNVVIIFEVKACNIDCTNQLFNQAYNTCLFELKENNSDLKNLVTPVDLNWRKLMALTIKIANFEKAIGHTSRFITDFIQYIQNHNYKWLPEIPISALSPLNSQKKITRRILSAINASKLKNLSNRNGFEINVPWVEEVLFHVNNRTGDLLAIIYPGNTKNQGIHLFTDDKRPKFKHQINILSSSRFLQFLYHIKLSHFQKFFTGLWFKDNDLREELYTNKIFWKFSGRRKRGDDNWKDIEELFDHHFRSEYDWKAKGNCDWQDKVINSGKNQFDISFGYEISLLIPFKELQLLDTNKDDLSGLINLFEDIHKGFSNLLID